MATFTNNVFKLSPKFGRKVLEVQMFLLSKQIAWKGDKTWNCQCECGKQKVITSKSLQSGTQSCGCNKRKPHIRIKE